MYVSCGGFRPMFAHTFSNNLENMNIQNRDLKALNYFNNF